MLKKINKYQKHNRKKLPVLKLNIIFGVLWLVISTAYLATLNDIIAKGYKMKKIESQLLELENKNKNLTLNVAGKQSMEGVAARIKDLGMVDAGSVMYLTAPQTAVVRK